MRKRTSILLLVCCVVFALLLWLVTTFSLRPAVCSMPVPGATADPPEGQVALSTIQLLPRYRVPVTFTDVQVQDLTTGERLHPDLVLYDQESVHLLMTSTVVCTREDFDAYFSEAPQFPVQGATLCSENIALGTLWTQWPEWSYPTKYTISYRLFGIFPKQESILYHWDTMKTEQA